MYFSNKVPSVGGGKFLYRFKRKRQDSNLRESKTLRREGDSNLTDSVQRLDILFRFAHKISQTAFRILSSHFKNQTQGLVLKTVAERGGFEPPIRFPVYILSKDARSTTLPSLHIYFELAECPTSRPLPFSQMKLSLSNFHPLCHHSGISDIIPHLSKLQNWLVDFDI